MPFEDMGIMRGIPQMTVIEPSDNVQLKNLIPQIANTYGMFYVRMVRKDVDTVYDDGSTFEIGKAAKVLEGSDLTIIASGYLVSKAVLAARELEKEGIHARVLDIFTWKPIDKEAIISAAKETGAIVTCENHNIINGLGSAVAEVLVQNCPVPVEMVGVRDEFGEVGPVSYLEERFKMRVSDVVEAANAVIKRK